MEDYCLEGRKNKSKEHFVDELVEISRQVSELKALENRRAQAEQALAYIKERALFLSWAMENSQPIFAAYPDGRIIACNRAFLSLTGYMKEELNKMTWTEGLTPPELRSQVALVLDEVRRAKQPQHYRQEYIRKDGMLVEVELVTNQACDLNGRFRYYYFIIKDSQLKPVKNKLLAYQRQVAEFIELVPNATAVIGVDGTVLAWNRAMEKITGISKGQITGNSYRDYARSFYGNTAPALTELVLNGNDAAQAGQGQVEKLGHILWTDLFIPSLFAGREAFFRVAVTPLYDESGELAGVVESVCDLSGQKRVDEDIRKGYEEIKELFSEHINKLIAANLLLEQEIKERRLVEESVRRTEQERELFLGSISERIVFYDANMRVLWANRAAGEAFGQAPEQLVGAHHHDLGCCSGLDCPLERALETARPQEGKTILDGRVWVVRGYPVQGVSGRNGVVEVAFEVAGEAGIQKDLRLDRDFEQEMARLDRLNLVGEMAAGIGHEIRNPMTVVRGFLQFLSGKSDAHKYKEYYNLMIEELDRANSVITEFLSLAKNRTLNLAVKNLNLIIKAVYPILKADAAINEKYIKLDLNDIPDLLLDEKEICQLMLKLVRNALEAMPAGGNVTVRTFSAGDDVVLSIHDQGKGMDKTALEKLGTPFFTTKDYGTGLGLAACYSIANRHGASIEVDTGPGGTTFYVRFCKNQVGVG